jgi:hypothetical protein
MVDDPTDKNNEDAAETADLDNSMTAEGSVAAAAIALAFAARMMPNDPGVHRETERFLQAQTQVLETQRSHLLAEHTARLTHLHRKSHFLCAQRLGQLSSIVYKTATALIAAAIAVGIGVLKAVAHESRGHIESILW